MRAAGRGDRAIQQLWAGVAVICTLATVVGFAIADAVGNDARAAIDGFAAGALLVMLADSMLTEARRDAGRWAGLAVTLGFAVAAALSGVS
jgi:ZIP family zinc transporter